jgi:hypothetical protein
MSKLGYSTAQPYGPFPFIYDRPGVLPLDGHMRGLRPRKVLCHITL